MQIEVKRKVQEWGHRLEVECEAVGLTSHQAFHEKIEKVPSTVSFAIGTWMAFKYMDAYLVGDIMSQAEEIHYVTQLDILKLGLDREVSIVSNTDLLEEIERMFPMLESNGLMDSYGPVLVTVKRMGFGGHPDGHGDQRSVTR